MKIQLTSLLVMSLLLAAVTSSAQTIGTANIQNNAITTPKLTNYAVTTAKLATNAVTAINIASSAVTTSKLSNYAVTNPKLAFNSVAATNIQSQAVTTAHIKDGAVSSTKIATGAVSNSKLTPNAVATTNIATAAVTNPKLAANAVTADKIAVNQIVKSVNSVKDHVTLVAGQNVAINTAGNMIQISSSVPTNATVIGDWRITTGTVEGISNALVFSNGGAARVGMAPNGALTEHGTQAGMKVAGGVLIDGDLHVTSGASFDQDVFLSQNLQAAGDICGNTFCVNSDRNLKENFTPVESVEILDRVVKLPISSWTFKRDGVRHIGPMAQDFYAAFGVGSDDKRIATVDEGGVALAAIQGLNELLKEKDAKIETLEKRLSALEALMTTPAKK